MQQGTFMGRRCKGARPNQGVAELWDDTGHDITGLAKGFNMLNVQIFHAAGLGDCLTPVANIVQEN